MTEQRVHVAVNGLCHTSINRQPADEEILDMLAWIDSLELACPKKHLAREFSDGVLIAQLISIYLPMYVNLGSYTKSLSRKNKLNNWTHLNEKVFRKLGYKLEKDLMSDVIDAKPGAIEKVLFDIRTRIARKNRSILNYRIGLPPVPTLPLLPPPHIPTELTQAAQNKVKPKVESKRSANRSCGGPSMIPHPCIPPAPRQPNKSIKKLVTLEATRTDINGNCTNSSDLPPENNFVEFSPWKAPVKIANPSAGDEGEGRLACEEKPETEAEGFNIPGLCVGLYNLVGQLEL